MNILEVDNVTLFYNHKEILKGIYLKAEKGKITGILGKNGCGKTSLLGIIFGQLKPKNKLIRIDNIPIIKPLFLTKNISYLPQFNIIPSSFTIKKAFHLYNVDLNNFYIDFPDFKNFLNFDSAKFKTLSGGEKRVIEIYLTLLSKSKIILLDEPFSHVAPIYIEKIKSILNSIKKDKIIILTDHLYTEVLSLTDSLYLIKDGYTKLIENYNDLILNKYVNQL